MCFVRSSLLRASRFTGALQQRCNEKAKWCFATREEEEEEEGTVGDEEGGGSLRSYRQQRVFQI